MKSVDSALGDLYLHCPFPTNPSSHQTLTFPHCRPLVFPLMGEYQVTFAGWQVQQSQEFLHAFLTEGAGKGKQRNPRVLGRPPRTTWKYWHLLKGLPFQEPRKPQTLWLQAANKAGDLAPLPLPLN